MTSARTYLDHNATTPLRPEAREAVHAALDLVGNPSSVHAEGRRARATLEIAREQVAAMAGALPREVVFTSGATESNAAVLRGGWHRIVHSNVEHDSVMAPARDSGAEVVQLVVDGHGRLDLDRLEQVLAGDGGGSQTLVSVQQANNETGVLQSLADVIAIARRHGARVHSDAVQAAGRIPVAFGELELDFMALSAHKIGGPKGVGALIVRDGLGVQALVSGGGQERGVRAGTENVAGIAGFGAAAAVARRDREELAARCARYRGDLERGLGLLGAGIGIIGADTARLPNTTCATFPGRSAETLVMALDLGGVAVSAGAACSSGKVKSSHVLSAMGLPAEAAGSAIRFSTGWTTTALDIEICLSALAGILRMNTGSPRKVA